MVLLLRLLVGAIGIFALLGVSQHWFSLDAVSTARGMQAIGDIGRANLRADVGGLFLGIACFALFAALRQNLAALLAAATLLSATLIGRLVSVAVDGYSARMGPPMIIEAIVLSVFFAAFRVWNKKPEGL